MSLRFSTLMLWDRCSLYVLSHYPHCGPPPTPRADGIVPKFPPLRTSLPQTLINHTLGNSVSSQGPRNHRKTRTARILRISKRRRIIPTTQCKYTLHLMWSASRLELARVETSSFGGFGETRWWTDERDLWAVGYGVNCQYLYELIRDAVCFSTLIVNVFILTVKIAVPP
jgi:hypothetical protein